MENRNFCPNCTEEIDGIQEYCPHCGEKVYIMNEPHQLPIGIILCERYQIGKQIGEGGLGITYVGRDLKLDMKVAVKEYFPCGMVKRINADSYEITVKNRDTEEMYEEGKKKFLYEAQILAKFSEEPHVVCVRDYFTTNNTAYIVMEYLNGISLQEYLNEYGKMSFKTAFELLSPVMMVLEKIHNKGLIHRDISPSNLMLLTDGRVKLINFGTARPSNITGEKSLSIILNPNFAPEEQYRKHGEQGSWTDVYAFCATIYNLITGKELEKSMDRAYHDTLKPPRDYGAAITPVEEMVLMRGLAIHKDNRIQSMIELQRAFESAAEKNGLYSQPVTEACPDKKRAKEKIQTKQLSVALILVIGCMTVMLAFFQYRNRPYQNESLDTLQYSNSSTIQISDETVTQRMIKTIVRNPNVTVSKFENCSLNDQII